MRLKAAGFEGIFYDFISLIIALFKVDVFLLLGIQGIPLAFLLKMMFNKKIVTNVGGIEWERPKFNWLAKLYLKVCFRLSFLFSNHIILDNEHYRRFSPKTIKAKVNIIPYGGTIDNSLVVEPYYKSKYPFLGKDYYLSISRSLKDNQLYELCNIFIGTNKLLVLISNFSRSQYGRYIMDKFRDEKNIHLIDGLYIKPELDLVRRHCKAYIHTHTLCGTAPSLVEMIVAQRPIVAIDNPQNRYTLNHQGHYFSEFIEIKELIKRNKRLDCFIPSKELAFDYNWAQIVNKYEALY